MSVKTGLTVHWMEGKTPLNALSSPAREITSFANYFRTGKTLFMRQLEESLWISEVALALNIHFLCM